MTIKGDSMKPAFSLYENVNFYASSPEQLISLCEEADSGFTVPEPRRSHLTYRAPVSDDYGYVTHRRRRPIDVIQLNEHAGWRFVVRVAKAQRNIEKAAKGFIKPRY